MSVVKGEFTHQNRLNRDRDKTKHSLSVYDAIVRFCGADVTEMLIQHLYFIFLNYKMDKLVKLDHLVPLRPLQHATLDFRNRSIRSNICLR